MMGTKRSSGSEPLSPNASVAPWDIKASQAVCDLKLFRVRLDTAVHPRTGRTYERVVLESPDWVNVIAVTPDDRCVMVRQFRFGTRETTLEIPGGMVDSGETPDEAARRELLEETGFSAVRWTLLATVRPNPAFLDNTCHHFLAEAAVQRRAPHDEGGEDIGVELVPVPELPDRVRSGEIDHSLVVSALCRVLDLRVARGPRP